MPSETRVPSDPRPSRGFSRSPLVWPLLALAGLLLYNLVVTPAFFALRVQDGHLYGSLVDVLRNGAPTALIALAMTLVIATRGIDLSVGASVAISGAVACTWIAGSPDPTAPGTAVVAIALALGLCLVLGVFNGMLVAGLGIQPIIATLVLMTAGRGLAQLVTDGQIVTVSNPFFSAVGGGFLLGLPIPVLLTAAAFVVVALVTRRTALGLLVESVGVNPTASRLVGIRSRGIVWGAYVLTAVCAGLAGLMLSSTVNAADANNAGLWIELDAILAVVIGGTLLTGGRYSIVGTLVGALVLQTLTTTVYTTGIRPEITLVFKALVIIAVCLLQSPKLRRTRRPPAAAPPASPPAPREPAATAAPTPASTR